MCLSAAITLPGLVAILKYVLLANLNVTVRILFALLCQFNGRSLGNSSCLVD